MPKIGQDGQQTSQGVDPNLTAGFTEGGNPAFGGMVERSIRPMRREFTETVLPGIASGYAGSGRLPGACCVQ